HYSAERLEQLKTELSINTTTSNREAYLSADIAVLCVRPQAMDAVLRELRDVIEPTKLLTSIAAGLPMVFYEERLGSEVPFIRAMPTFFGPIRAGTTGLALSPVASAEHLALASRLFGTVSENVIVLPDSEMDAFTTFGSTTTATVYMLL